MDIITALAAFTVEKDPWTTKLAFEKASCILGAYESCIRSKDSSALATLLGDILKRRVKPLFSKTKNPAITPAGRKNVHPVPPPRFDSSLFDPESKPWRFTDVYSITVLTWIMNRYLVCLFSLSVPLALLSHPFSSRHKQLPWAYDDMCTSANTSSLMVLTSHVTKPSLKLNYHYLFHRFYL